MRKGQFLLKEPVSAITHFIAFLLAIIETPVILCLANIFKSATVSTISIAIFMLCMALLYGSSAAYHSFDISEKGNGILKKIDHCSVFILIAGSYTPICLNYLNKSGIILLVVIWSLAVLGIVFKLCWIDHPMWISSLMYISMGWIVIVTVPELIRNMPMIGFIFLVTGGVLYTIGGVIYSLKVKIFKKEEQTGFGNHELFHIFVMLGSTMHYIVCILLVVLV